MYVLFSDKFAFMPMYQDIEAMRSNIQSVLRRTNLRVLISYTYNYTNCRAASF